MGVPHVQEISGLPAEAFSPNTAAGACPHCHGLGVVHDVAEDLLVPDPALSIRDGAIAAWPQQRRAASRAATSRTVSKVVSRRVRS